MPEQPQPEAEDVVLDDEVTITIRVQVPDGDDLAERHQRALDVARQYQTVVWDITPAHGGLRGVDTCLPDWQPVRVYQRMTVIPRLAAVEDRA